MNRDDRDYLRTVATDATPGPYGPGLPGDCVIHRGTSRAHDPAEELRYYGGAVVGESLTKADRKYFAALAPEVVLGMLDTIEALHHQLGRVVGTWTQDDEKDMLVGRTVRRLLLAQQPSGNAHVSVTWYRNFVTLGYPPLSLRARNISVSGEDLDTICQLTEGKDP